MDLSSLPEAQQQQLEQLQQKFKEHQAQRQQEEEQQQQQLQLQQQQQQQQQQQHYQQQQQQQNQHYASSQAYDPSQVQAYDHSQYDPSHASYYSYYQYPQQHSQQHPQQNQLQHHHQEQQHQQQQQHQQYAYDQSGYANAYQQHPVQHESGPVHTEGVTVSREGASSQMMDGGGGSGQGQVQHQQNVYYPHDLGDQRQHQHQQHQSLAAAAAEVVAAAAYPELNPAAAAAVAALSQLAQFAGNMDAAERAMTELQGRHSYGNGERFGRMMGPAGPFMGPCRMHPLVGQPPFRGGGRRGGGPFRGGNRENFRHSHPRSGGSGPPFRGRGRSRGRGGPRRFPSHNASSESSQPDPSAADDAESTGEEEDPSAAEPEEAHEAEARTVASPSASVPGMATPNPRPPQAVWCELCRVDCNSLEILEQHKNGKKHKKNLQKIEELKTADKPGAGIKSEQNPEAGSHQEVSLQSETVQVTENLPTDSTADENIMNIEQHTDSVQQPAEGTSDLQARNQSNNVRRGTKRKMRGGRGGKRMRSFEASRHPYEPPRPKVVIPIICDLCNVKCDTQEVFDRHLAGKKHISKLKRFEGHQAMYGPMVQALYPPNPIAQTLYHPQGQPPPFYGTQSLYPPPGPYMPPQPHQAAAAPMPVNSISASEGMGSYPPPNNTTIGNEQVKAIMLTDYGATAGNVSFPGLDIQAKEGQAE